MKTQPSFSPDDQIVQLLLRVARRADAAVRATVVNRSHDRRVWLRAECEVFELMERTNAAVSAAPGLPFVTAR